MEQEAIRLLKEILSVPTVNGRNNEGRLAQYICDYLEDAGIHSKVIWIDEMHANIMAVLDGKTSAAVIWNGHLDTVPYGEEKEWNTDPSQPFEKNGKVYARGASDMKSGLAAMVYALADMKRKCIVPEKTVYFLGTCDEECTGIGARQAVLQKYVPDAELLLIGEPTGLRLGVAQKGCVWIKLQVFGKTSHGAYPKEGTNAVEYGIYACETLKEQVEEREHQILGNATAQITKVKGGIAPNMTPDKAEFTIDIRILPGMSSSDIGKMLEGICARLQKESGNKAAFQYQIINDRKAIEIESTHPWVETVRTQLQKEKIEPEEIGINYFTDASILTAGKNIPVLLLGPGEPAMAHRPNEYVEIHKYLDFIKILIHIFGEETLTIYTK